MTLATQLVDAGIHGQALEPGAERRVASIAADRIHHLQKHFVHHVLGLLALPENAQRELETGAAKTAVEFGKRLHVAALRASQ